MSITPPVRYGAADERLKFFCRFAFHIRWCAQTENKTVAGGGESCIKQTQIGLTADVTQAIIASRIWYVKQEIFYLWKDRQVRNRRQKMPAGVIKADSTIGGRTIDCANGTNDLCRICQWQQAHLPGAFRRHLQTDIIRRQSKHLRFSPQAVGYHSTHPAVQEIYAIGSIDRSQQRKNGIGHVDEQCAGLLR